MDFAQKIRVIEDFPKPGISFKDITSLLKNGETYHKAIDALVDKVLPWKPELILGPEARGFLLGAPLAYALGVGFVPVRKQGKLPGETVSETYELEYGTDTLEVHAADLHAGQRIAIVDDLLATGGTMLATARLAEKIGAEVVGMSFLIELSELGGREKLKKYPVFSLVQY
ncbi:adenine phosphoribosyltransferase [Desulfitobacterium sp. Sab5]|uniref:adenine phosphoribosyltransferase n=1 Tax=Desulfitobacterium nosdiversum TaxID=3375356 RepID=UPI003CEA1319